MRMRDPTVWMWSEAISLLERAERIERQCFQLGEHRYGGPRWEPPVDLFETERQFVVLVALPGVVPEQLIVTLEDSVVSVRGQRVLPDLGPNAHLHRMEIPYGFFERRIELPAHQLRLSQHQLRDGCLLLTLDKPGATP